VAFVVCGCSATIGDNQGPRGRALGPDGKPIDDMGGGGETGTTPGGKACAVPMPVPQRIVRLDYNKLANTLTSLLGADALKNVVLPANVGNIRQRDFQALFTEGNQFDPTVLSSTFTMIDQAVTTNVTGTAFTALTGCPATPTDACIQAFLPSFAAKAYRRPITDDEKTAFLKFYADQKTAGSPVDEAAHLAIEAVLMSPPSLYRMEIGHPALNGFEVASQLSYFITDHPPDQPLIDAAQSGKLTTTEGKAAEVERLIQSPGGIENLSQVMDAYYQLGQLDQTIKDPMLFPEFTVGLRNAMYTETDKFIRDALWNGKVNDLLTSPKSFANSLLSSIYGVKGGADTDTFASVTFPAGQRTGLLGQASILSMRSRTNTTSVVSRGLYINSSMLCLVRPADPPASVKDKVTAQLADATATERQKSDFRTSTSPCNGCHRGFDPYGLALENYDAIGRYRDTYPGNIAIDATATLPDAAGGAHVKNGVELEGVIAQNGLFGRCLTSNLMKYALGDVTLVDPTDCAVGTAFETYQGGDQTFTSMVRSVALSNTLSNRAVGQ
jgi:hypothetical protein